MKQTPKIAFFCEKLYDGGVERIMQIIARNFDYSRCEFTLYSHMPEDMPEGTFPPNICQRYIFSRCEGNILQRFCGKVMNKLKLWVYYHGSPRLFYRLFIRQRYDVAVAFIEGYAARYVAGAPTGTRKIGWVHTNMETNHWTDVAFRSREEERWCYHQMDVVPCVSEVVREQAIRLFDISDRAIVLHNPIETDTILRKSEEEIADFFSTPGVPAMVSLGHLIEVKGYDRLIPALARLRDEGIRFTMLILGRGADQEMLQSLIDQNHLRDVVRLGGFRHNPYPYVRRADVYVCSSRAEGYNTAISEAIILGRAIVSTEVSGIREQLGANSEYGIITENSEDGIYEGLRRMLTEPSAIARYQRLSEGRQCLFNLQTQMEEIYHVIGI